MRYMGIHGYEFLDFKEFNSQFLDLMDMCNNTCLERQCSRILGIQIFNYSGTKTIIYFHLQGHAPDDSRP